MISIRMNGGMMISTAFGVPPASGCDRGSSTGSAVVHSASAVGLFSGSPVGSDRGSDVGSGVDATVTGSTVPRMMNMMSGIAIRNVPASNRTNQ